MRLGKYWVVNLMTILVWSCVTKTKWIQRRVNCYDILHHIIHISLQINLVLLILWNVVLSLEGLSLSSNLILVHHDISWPWQSYGILSAHVLLRSLQSFPVHFVQLVTSILSITGETVCPTYSSEF